VVEIHDFGLGVIPVYLFVGVDSPDYLQVSDWCVFNRFSFDPPVAAFDFFVDVDGQ
jgi:hypothetical protein